MNENFAMVLSNNEQITAFENNPEILFSGTYHQPILLLTPKPGEVMCNLMENLDIVVAGGGLVWNEHGELLMIYRRGMWDLPKGKIELKESIIHGAVREVEEETGVRVARTEPAPVTTYHAYTLKGKRWLKQTEWFTMLAQPGQLQLTPQTEEDIEEVRWVKRADLATYKDGCYPLIWDLVKEYAE
jgi:8-oxo-dGTP pyrophosphatase MutT (NUDIX family)